MDLNGVFLLGLTLFFVIYVIIRVCMILFWKPYQLTKLFRGQGIVGPPYKVLSGSLQDMKKMKKAATQRVLDTNSHEITQRVLPHYHTWCSRYGELFLYWYGTEPRVYMSEAEAAKQILSNKFGFFAKPRIRPLMYAMAGNGLVFVEGLDWVKHRRILNSAFTANKLRVMVKKMAACTLTMLDKWENKISATAEIEMEMHGEFRKLTANVIAHTAFGSSYVQGKEAFEAQRELQALCAASITDIFIPGTQYLPTPSNIRIWKLRKKLERSLSCIIESRLNSYGCKYEDEDDLLGIMVASAASNSGPKLSLREIMEECKTFFFAGQETTSSLLTWTVYLLSLYPEWQEKLRQEVIRECGTSLVLDAYNLSKLKVMNMVLRETLRLYGPVLEIFREALQDMKVVDVFIPKGTSISLPLVKIHRSKEYWGEDANEFNPERFKNGLSNAANHPNALLAFSVGPRVCIGQNFAMLEAKMVIALLLQRFSLSLSPTYKHAPTNNLTLQPQYGLPTKLTPLSVPVVRSNKSHEN